MQRVHSLSWALPVPGGGGGDREQGEGKLWGQDDGKPKLLGLVSGPYRLLRQPVPHTPPSRL